MADLSQEIADLEIEMEQLAATAERCRKGILVGKIAAAGSIVLLGVLLFGLVRASGEALVLAIAAGLGGTALVGTNQSTLDETTGRISALAAQRSALIDNLELRTVALT